MVFIPFLALTTVSVLITSKYISLILSSSPVYSAASLTIYPAHLTDTSNLTCWYSTLDMPSFCSETPNFPSLRFLHFSKETIFRVPESKDLGYGGPHSSVSWFFSLSLFTILFPLPSSQPLLSLTEMNESSCLLRSLPVHSGHPISYPW